MSYQETTPHTPESLMEIQIGLEEHMTARGIDRYWKNLNGAKESEREDQTAYGQKIIAGKLDILATHIGTWLADASRGGVGRLQISSKLVLGWDPRKLAYLSLKALLAGISKPRTLQYVAVQIGSLIETEQRMQEIRDHEQKTYERLLKEAEKRGSTFHRRMYAVRASEAVLDFEGWTKTERLHLGVKMLDLIMESVGLIEIMETKTSATRTIKMVKALPDTLDWIDRRNGVVQYLRPVYEPMVVIPKNWEGPYGGGYVSSHIPPLVLVKTKNRNYLEELQHADMPLVYDSVNALQRTPWQINRQVFDVLNTLWEMGSELGGIPPKDGMPLPPKPFDIDTNEAARKEWRARASKTHQQNVSMTGQRVGLQLALDIAGRYKDFRKIYFPYQLDFRGRIYAVPHLNPQGADYQKAMLRFSNGKPLGAEGWKWLAVHGSNLAGYDKVSLEDRVNWVLDNEDEIVACATDPYANKGWCMEIAGIKIDKPWQFLAFCYEWKGYCEQGDDFVSKLPVALDGSCSGIQHFSAMLKDPIGGKAVNLVPADKPQDVYAMVAENVIRQVQDDLVNGTDDELRHNDIGTPYILEGSKVLAKQWLGFGITRKVTKRSVMTLAYGSKEFGFKDQLMEDILRPAYAAAMKEGREFPFQADGYRAAIYMAKKIWIAVTQTLVGPATAMAWLQDASRLVTKEGLPVSWTTPIGFPVQQDYRDVTPRRVKTHLNGKLIYITMNHDSDKIDRSRMANGISPNFVHSCDAAHLMLTVANANASGIENFAMIHDSFGTCAADTELLFRVIRESFVQIYGQMDVLQNFRDDIENQLSEENREKLKPVPAKGDLDVSQVCDSKYCFA